MVAAVLKEAAGVLGTEHRDSRAHRFEENFSAAGFSFAYEARWRNCAESFFAWKEKHCRRLEKYKMWWRLPRSVVRQ